MSQVLTGLQAHNTTNAKAPVQTAINTFVPIHEGKRPAKIFFNRQLPPKTVVATLRHHASSKQVLSEKQLIEGIIGSQPPLKQNSLRPAHLA